jgi:hypothetical protein
MMDEDGHGDRTMVLTISEERYRAIRAAVEARRMAAEVAKTDWDKLPHFTSVDDFLTFLDTVVEPATDHPAGRSGNP